MLRTAQLLRSDKLAAYLSDHPVSLAVVICVAWTLLGLLGHDPWKPDEAHTFGVAYQMLQNGDWVVPMLAGEPFLEKSPLAYLVAAAFGWLLSPVLQLHDAARLSAGAWMAATFVFMTLAARELYGSDKGWLTALMLLGCGGLLLRAHQINTDLALVSGLAIGLYALSLFARRALAAGIWLGTGLGIVTYSTGLAEPLMLIAAMLILPLVSPHWRSRNYAICAGIAALAWLPWAVLWPYALYQRAPELFQQWFWIENMLRLRGMFSLDAGVEPFYYLNILPWFAWPALPFALWTLWSEGRAGLRAPGIILPLVVFACFLAFLSFIGESRDALGLPLLLPLALLACAKFEKLQRGAINAYYWFAIMLFTVFTLVGWFYWMAIDIGIPGRLASHMADMQPGYERHTPLLMVFGALIFTIAWLLLLFNVKRSQVRPVVLWAAGNTVMWAIVSLLLVNYIDTGKSYRAMVAQLSGALPQSYRCIYSQSVGDAQRAMLHYFGDVVTVRLEKSGPRPDCDLLITQDNWKSPGRAGGQWEMIWEGRRPGDKQERYRLYRQAPEGTQPPAS